MAEQRFDVCVVGAGVAGLACAQGLARQGASVVLLDRLDPMPNSLKAEKIDGEAVIALLRLGFQPAVESALTPLHNVSIFFGERDLGTLQLAVPEAGGHYHVLINSLRAHLDPRVAFIRATKVVGFEQRPDGVEVLTDKGERVACRLVVIATGDARHLVEPLGGKYQTRAPHHVFVAGFTMEDAAGDPHPRCALMPADTQTYHRPVAGGPIAYATFFRLGSALRANIFCPGPVTEEWQRDLKQRPLEVMSEHNRRLAAASKGWQVASPVMIRKLQVMDLQPPASPRVVVLGDAAHVIDPAGGGGLTFALLETEIFLNFHAESWLKACDCGPEAINGFYEDPRRVEATRKFFDRGRYIFALNHDTSPRGSLRRQLFFAQTRLRSHLSGAPTHLTQAESAAWRLPAPYLYET